mmetsp:Transcript_19290/g.35455  ORF Transcript_19290/g.35455 Transcript_19290/m.35455 type:complete len:342 (+) Transcript_19290:1580-2605(+)
MSGSSSPSNTCDFLSLSTDSSQHSTRSRKVTKLLSALKSPVVQLGTLKNLCWGGIHFIDHRVLAWKLILEYLPSDIAQRTTVLNYKRHEYARLIEVFYNSNYIDPNDAACIRADIPRIRIESELMRKQETADLLGRVLGLWSIRNPVPGYMSGLHEVCGLLAFAFLRDFYSGEALGRDETALMDVEADIFWCFGAVVAYFQDFYIPGNPGVQRALIKVEDVLRRKEPGLCAHFEQIDFNIVYFAHRWLKCLFTLELPVHLTLLIWDSFLSDEDPETSVTYLTAALILRFKQQLLSLSLEKSLELTNHLPTEGWTDDDVLTLASEAFSLQTVFTGSKWHFSS